MKPILSLIPAGILALAACGGGAAPAGSTASSPSSNQAVASAAASKSAVASAKPVAASAQGSGAPASAAAKGPIKVGIDLPLTGSFANLGNENADGFKAYLSSIHNTVAGRQIDAIFADSQAKPDVALTKAKELVQNQKVAVLMGMNTTPEGYAVAQWVKDEGHVPTMITVNSSAENMLTDPKFASPYLTRWTETSAEVVDPAADWAAKQGFRKASLLTTDFAPGIQIADLFASAFIRRGGSVVQQFYPAVATTDFGPFLAQLDQSADVIFTFVPGIDSLRFADQYSSYAGQHKPQIIDSFGLIASGENVAQLKDKVAGIVTVDVFDEGSDDPGTQAFVKIWRAAYPNRALSQNIAHGYASGQILAAAIEKVGGDVENTQAFLQALYTLQLDTGKGPVKLDQNHDIIENTYVYRTVKDGSGFKQQLLQTYPNVSDTWARSAQEIARFPFGKYKGKWVGMTKDQVDQALK